MIKDMEEMLKVGWKDDNGILDETSGEVAEKLINSTQPFVLIHVESDESVGFTGIAEYDEFGFALNLSKRSGVLTEEMKEMSIDEVFYHDMFGSDGSLVSLEVDGEQTLYQQISKAVDLSAFQCYLCAGKNMGEVAKLPAGNYFMVMCDKIMQKIKEQTRAVQDGQLHTGHR